MWSRHCHQRDCSARQRVALVKKSTLDAGTAHICKRRLLIGFPATCPPTSPVFVICLFCLFACFPPEGIVYVLDLWKLSGRNGNHFCLDSAFRLCLQRDPAVLLGHLTDSTLAWLTLMLRRLSSPLPLLPPFWEFDSISNWIGTPCVATQASLELVAILLLRLPEY